MGLNSNIQWTNHTANLWHGCTKVHEGCDNCYAEAQAHRFGKDIWGDDKPRLQIKSVWDKLSEFQDLSYKAGEKQRVFVGSMMDIFEKPMPMIDGKGNFAIDASDGSEILNEALRQQFFDNISNNHYPDLIFLLLTKRPSNINKMIPAAWLETPPENVMFGTSPVNQKTYDNLWKHLVKVKGKRFLSIEPQLDEITPKAYCPHCQSLLHSSLSRFCGTCHGETIVPDWIIVGGESGVNRRPFNIDWARIIQSKCKHRNIPFFFKQIDKVIEKTKGIPRDLQTREFPEFFKTENIYSF